ncbi:MAG: TM2 domain-containing protein [Actinobacteria bacterium]|nr:TM2 domain-containing protein [Actinomycetota bacterium]
MLAQPERQPEPERKKEPEREEILIVKEEPVPRKSRLAAGLLSILLGWLGVGRFYLGYPFLGALQIILTLLTGVGGLIWGIIDGVLILTNSINEDAYGRPLRD